MQSDRLYFGINIINFYFFFGNIFITYSCLKLHRKINSTVSSGNKTKFRRSPVRRYFRRPPLGGGETRPTILKKIPMTDFVRRGRWWWRLCGRGRQRGSGGAGFGVLHLRLVAALSFFSFGPLSILQQIKLELKARRRMEYLIFSSFSHWSSGRSAEHKL